jgi:hypothetical protein
LAELPVGATSAAQAVTVTKPTFLANALNNSSLGTMKEAVSADAKGKTYAAALVNTMKAFGQIPTTQPSSAPTIYTFSAIDLKGTMSQENPTSPPPPPPPQPSCPYGFASGPAYISPSWTGWDASGWTSGYWSYSCNPPPPPPPPVVSGPVLCQGTYCLWADGTVTNGGNTVWGLNGQVDDGGNIIIQQQNGDGTTQVVETITGVNAVNRGGIVTQSAATGVAGYGASVAGNQITVNETNLTTGQQNMALGGGYTYNPNSGQLCGPGGCVTASSNNGQITAVIGDSIVNAQIGTQTSNGNTFATSSIIQTTTTNIYTGQTTDVTGSTAVPVTGTGSSGGGAYGH